MASPLGEAVSGPARGLMRGGLAGTTRLRAAMADFALIRPAATFPRRGRLLKFDIK